MSLFDLLALLLTLSALFGWLNHKLLRLPQAIGLLVMGLAASLLLLLLQLVFPGQHLFAQVTSTIRQIDFTSLVMDGMLASAPTREQGDKTNQTDRRAAL